MISNAIYFVSLCLGPPSIWKLVVAARCEMAKIHDVNADILNIGRFVVLVAGLCF